MASNPHNSEIAAPPLVAASKNAQKKAMVAAVQSAIVNGQIDSALLQSAIDIGCDENEIRCAAREAHDRHRSLRQTLRANKESQVSSSRVLRNQTNGTRSGASPAGDDDDDDERKPADRTTSETSAHLLSSQFGRMQLNEGHSSSEEDNAQAVVNNKAWEFVQGVQQVCIDLESVAAPGIFPIEEEVLLSVTKRLLKEQQEFCAAKKPCRVDIGYIIAFRNNTPFVLQEHSATSWQNSIAIADDVSSFEFVHAKAGTYTMMARLLGGTEVSSGFPNELSFDGNDSATCRLNASAPFEQITLMKTSQQCLPLVHFSSSMIEPYIPGNAGNLVVNEHLATLQKLVDRIFNDSSPTPLPPLFKRAPVSLQYNAPATLAVPLRTISTPVYHATRNATSDNCCICLDPLHNEDAVSLKTCPHKFHSACLQQALISTAEQSRVLRCPICRAMVGEPRGQMPSATMTIQRCSETRCGGHAHSGSIVIEYRILQAVQQSYHPSPGQAISYTSATAYLPETKEGRELLKRLKYAFCHGLTFNVGRSGGQQPAPVYFAITHKQSPTGGYGFPDPTFFTRCNQQLDQAHVPPADNIH